MLIRFSLLQRAWGDLETASFSLDRLDDDIFLDVAAYHVEQAIEKVFKYTLSLRTGLYPETHKFPLIIDYAVKHGVSYPSWIDNYLDELRDFVGQTRYGSSLVAGRSTVRKLLDLATQWYDEVEREFGGELIERGNENEESSNMENPPQSSL